MSLTGDVYFARCFTARGLDMSAIKIGCSYHLPDRLDALACNLPFDCRLITQCPGSLFEEAIAHLWLKSHRIAGEYFHDAPEVLDFVSEVERTGRFPLKLSVASEYPLPTMAEARNFMARHGLVVADLAAASGVQSPSGYAGMIKRDLKPNRRFIAAMVVAALRKGRRVHWRSDLRHVEQEQVAA
jgi:hypothetical protein